MILLHRDIYAVCASKIYDSATIRRKKRMGFVIKYITLIAFLMDYIWLARFYDDNKKLFYLIFYEDLVGNPKEEINKLCLYCEIEMEENMMFANGKSSSHQSEKKRSFDQSKINIGIDRLNMFDKWLIGLFTKRSALKFKN